MRRRVEIADDHGRAVLLVDGAIQSVSPHDALRWGSYWASMVPPFSPKRVLVLGLAGATLPHLIAHRWGLGASMLGVDDDAEVLEVARKAGWLRLPGLRVEQADVFELVQRPVTDRFDYVGVDLYRGPKLVRRALGRPFLRALAGLIEPTGWLAINLLGETATSAVTRPVDEVFRVEHRMVSGENLVLHCRPRQGGKGGGPG